MERDITKSRSPMQTLYEICIEYNFSERSIFRYDASFQNLKKSFIAKGTITKEGKAYVYLGESSYKKKESKQNVAQKLLELLNEKYIFFEEKLPETKQNPSENYSDKGKLYKWTGACERCYKKGHMSNNCRRPKRNKNYQGTQ